MSPDLTGVYFTIFIVVGMVAYAGADETLKVFYYIGLQIRLQWINILMAIMRFRLKRQLDRMERQYKKDLEKINDERKQKLL